MFTAPGGSHFDRDGVPEPNLVWKDTVLVKTGETVDILLDVSNPGRWMAHCHIAEHHETGMMYIFDVDAASETHAYRLLNSWDRHTWRATGGEDPRLAECTTGSRRG